MSEFIATHATFELRRVFPVAPAKVFAAFARPEAKHQWFAESETAKAREYAMDFRVGGVDVWHFVMQDVEIINRTYYHDIQTDRHIVYTYTMSRPDAVFSVSLASVELVAIAQGTELVYSEQGTFLENADSPAMRQQGGEKLFARLAQVLEVAQ